VKRNKLANASIFMVTALFVAMVLVTNPSYAATDKPNIVLMMADNLGYGDLGVYGGGQNRGMPTPHIDKLANEGLRFEQFLVEHNCSPSRAATLTGRYSIRSMPSGTSILGSEITLAEMLKEVGYKTAAYGKWHLGWKEGQQPQEQGFDEFYGIKNSTNVILYPSLMREQGIQPGIESVACIYEFNKVQGKMEVVSPYNEKTRSTIDHHIAKLAGEYIQRQVKKDNPFFLYIPWTRVHTPNSVTDDFKNKSRIGPYGDGVMDLDHNTGTVLKAIKDNGIEENTIVIWMSDNGPMRTSAWPDGGSQGPYRGDIGSALEGSLRTAAMIKWPGHIKQGVVHGMFSLMDFFPTLAEFAGAKVPTDRPIDGINQANFLVNYQPPLTEDKKWKDCRKLCQFGTLLDKISGADEEGAACQVQENTNKKEILHDKRELIHQITCEKCPSGETARDNLLTFINGKLVAIRWKQFRIYFNNLLPQEGFMALEGSSSMNVPNLNPIVYNIERDPREVVDTLFYNSWAISRAMPYVVDYVKSVVKYPNPLASYANMMPEEIFLMNSIESAKE
jgi:arylsulfatase A-like enzyme